MFTIDDYLDLACKRQGTTSRRALAPLLGVNPSAISLYSTRRAWPADATMIRLANLAGLDSAQALMDLNLWRNDTPEVRNKYQQISDILKRAAVSLSLAAILVIPAGTQAEQNVTSSAVTVYYGKY